MPKPLALLTTLIVGGALLLLPTSTVSTAAAGAQRLTGSATLATIYDSILAARFDEAHDQLSRACPPAPAAACDAMREVAAWWEIQQNLESRALDARFETIAQTAVASATRLTEQEPRRAEAWFYLAGAYAPLSQWRVLRGERLTAARDGKRIKDALERSLALDPNLQDAWFGIGLYHYYADVAPTALKILRFLLLLPGGDRVEGMQEMLRAREHGELLRGEAAYQMHWLYLWYEHQPARALDLLRGLDAQYPSNPMFLQRIADVEHVYFSDHRASAEAWRTLLERAASRRVAFAPLADARARVGLAAESIELAASTRAVQLMEPLVRMRPTEPYGILALANLTLGDAYAHAGNAPKALEAYSHAIDTAPRDDPDAIRTRARDAIARVRAKR